MSLPPALRDFIAELRRRRVATVAAIYVAVAWLLLQIADLVVPGLLLPEWTYRFILLLLILGFPLALVLAWAFELTPHGVRRTERVTSTIAGSAGPPMIAPEWRRRTIGAAIFLLVLIAAWWVGRARPPSHLDSDEASAALSEGVAGAPLVSVAVLPFVNMSDDRSQEFFSEGISEELLNLLAGVAELHVISRTSSFAFKGQGLTAEQLGDTLHTRYLVEGSVRRDDQSVRITAQLIDTETGAHIWSDAWNRDMQDIFAVQEEIAAKVAAQLKVSLLGEGPTIEETDPEAYVLVLQAHQLAHENSRESAVRAVSLYKRALAIDPGYADGWSGLAQLYPSPVLLEEQPRSDFLTLARQAAEQALALDSTQGTAHQVMGSLASIEGDLADAARHYERALALAPGNSIVLTQVDRFLVGLGRFQDALRVARYATHRDPVDWLSYSNLGFAYLAAGRPGDAISPLQMARDLNPAAGGTRLLLGEAFLRMDQPQAALAAIEDEPHPVFRLMGLAEAYWALGQRDASDAALSELIDEHARLWAYQIALVLAERGETDRAFAWLDRAVENEDAGLNEVQPDFAPLKDDPRWRPFLERIGRTPEELAAVEFDVVLPEETGAEH